MLLHHCEGWLCLIIHDARCDVQLQAVGTLLQNNTDSWFGQQASKPLGTETAQHSTARHGTHTLTISCTMWLAGEGL
jgi:hypothetical protein